MKRLWFLLILLLALPVSAQNDALLLYTTQEDDLQTVYVLNADTGKATRITELVDALGYSWGDVGWSPDGRYVWIVDTPTENRQRLRLFDPSGGSETTITDNLFPDSCIPALYWSPDGQSLSYVTGEEADHAFQLLNLSDGSAYSFEDLTLPMHGGKLIWSPYSRYVVMGSGILVDASNGSLVAEVNANTAQFSPDGRFLALRGARLYDLVTNDLIDLGPGSVARWSPDGRYLVFYEHDEQGRPVYFYYELESSTVYSINLDQRVSNHVGWWQGDLLLVTYLTDNGSPQTLLRFAMETGAITPVVVTPGFIGQVAVNGEWLAATYKVGDERGYFPDDHLRITNGETVLDSELIIHSAIDNNARGVTWSPDGRWLSVRAENGIYRFTPQTTTLERLPVDAYSFGVPMWSPNSRYLIFDTFHTADAGQSNKITMLWNTETDTIEPIEQQVGTIIGWQNGDTQDSLLYCGEG